VERQQAGLLQRLALEVPEDIGGQAAVADQREAEGVLGLDAGQPRRRVEDGVEAIALGPLARLGGDAPRDRDPGPAVTPTSDTPQAEAFDFANSPPLGRLSPQLDAPPTQEGLEDRGLLATFHVTSRACGTWRHNLTACFRAKRSEQPIPSEDAHPAIPHGPSRERLRVCWVTNQGEWVGGVR